MRYVIYAHDGTCRTLEGPKADLMRTILQSLDATDQDRHFRHLPDAGLLDYVVDLAGELTALYRRHAPDPRDKAKGLGMNPSSLFRSQLRSQSQPPDPPAGARW